MALLAYLETQLGLIEHIGEAHYLAQQIKQPDG